VKLECLESDATGMTVVVVRGINPGQFLPWQKISKGLHNFFMNFICNDVTTVKWMLL